ncbi:MAG: DNA primase [Bacteroidales bacterium]
MIPDQITDRLNEISIVSVIESYSIKLKPKGHNFEACCPFHDEKTASFTVFTKNNNFKCFGCGIQGGPITFVKEYQKIGFVEACKKLGSTYHIDIPERELTPKEIEIHVQKESLLVANSFAAAYFKTSLLMPENQSVLDYALSRWEQKTIEKFEIGFAPEAWDGLLTVAKQSGFKEEVLHAAGLISESSKTPGKFFDYFRNRLIIPIQDKSGHVIGFTGRTLGKDEKKYFNTKTTPIYHKGNQLFGINFAYEGIRYHENAYLVEGNADVIRMHQIGVPNTVGICSTSFTVEQLNSIKSICSTITIIPDSDPAGKKSIDRTAKMIMDSGMSCNVLELPFDKDNKVDADSFFINLDQFDKYLNENVTDYIINQAVKFSKLPGTPTNRSKAVNDISDLIFRMEADSRQMYIEQVSRLIKPKKAWQDRLKELIKDGIPEVVREDKTERIPDHVSLVDWQKYGFYADKNCYYFRTGRGDIERGCNFTLVPLFHIESVLNAKRIFRITNEYGITRVIEIAQRDLISLGAFKNCIESLGNFLWEVSDTELNKLKRYLYQETKSCTEVTQLGWHKDGFYSWGNGIFNGSFTKVDQYGIASHDDVNYYLPAFSSVYEKENQLYMSERQFMHRDENTITLQDYSRRLIKVFGKNASIALCFYFSSLFRDIIIHKMNFFPILDLFGPKGTGKTELAVSILSFFGKMGKGPNINNTSKAALADHVSQLRNACAHIDEYKNSIELDKHEFLKGLWDGTGRTRMNMDKDKKKETTAVDCAVILSGQEMPTADIALFSRLVYLTFNKESFSDAEKQQFNELKAIETLGNTHITNQILSLRKTFSKNYDASYDTVARDLTRTIGEIVIEDRIFKNWLVILASYHAIQDLIEVAFNYDSLIKLSAEQIIIQNSETKKSSEISSFWSIVQYLASDGMVHDGVDYRIERLKEVETDLMTSPKEYKVSTRIIFIQFSKIFHLYRKHGKQTGEKILPLDSLQYYIEHDNRYLGKKRTRFRFLDTTLSAEGVWSTKPEWSYVFEYDSLKIDLSSTSTDDELPDELNPKPTGPGRPTTLAVPYDYNQKKLSDEF